MTTGFDVVWSAAAEVGVRSPAVTPANPSLEVVLDEDDSTAVAEAALRPAGSSGSRAPCRYSHSSSASESGVQLFLRDRVLGHARNPRAMWLKRRLSYKDLMTSSRVGGLCMTDADGRHLDGGADVEATSPPLGNEPILDLQERLRSPRFS